MLDINEQTELDILLTVEEPNEYMKNRIKELQEKAELPNEGKKCSSLSSAIKGSKTALEHHQAIIDYCFKGTTNGNIKEDFYTLNPEHKEQIDRLWEALEIDSLTPISGKWANRIIKKYLPQYTPDNKEFAYFKELANSNQPNPVKQLFLQAIINMQKEFILASSISTNVTSFVALIDVAIFKTCIAFIIDLALEYDKDFDNVNLINISLSNINSYLSENLKDILYALSEHLENSKIGTL